MERERKKEKHRERERKSEIHTEWERERMDREVQRLLHTCRSQGKGDREKRGADESGKQSEKRDCAPRYREESV